MGESDSGSVLKDGECLLVVSLPGILTPCSSKDHCASRVYVEPGR